MKCFSNSAEDRIKEAARKVFLEKGFDGTTTRDIAKEAGVNSALMNYYFRSKEKLFDLVFEDLLRLFFQGMTDIINEPIDLKEKIGKMVEHDFRMFKENASLSTFIHYEIHRDPERLLKAVPMCAVFTHSMVDEQLKEGVAAGTIRPIDSMHLLMLLVANVQFIFHSKAMTMKVWEMTEADFDAFSERHKQIVIEMITSFLYMPHPVT
jgi:TetR/AcrR family transcriptional regulator